MLNSIAGDILNVMRSKGFFTPFNLENYVGDITYIVDWRGDQDPIRESVEVSFADLMLGKLMLVVSELGEYEEAPTRENAGEELADAAIRILHILAALKFEIDAGVQEFAPPPSHLERSPVGAVVYLSRAAEACRHKDQPGLCENLCQAFRVINSQASVAGFDLIEEIEKKMVVNRGRPYLHGTQSAT